MRNTRKKKHVVSGWRHERSPPPTHKSTYYNAPTSFFSSFQFIVKTLSDVAMEFKTFCLFGSWRVLCTLVTGHVIDGFVYFTHSKVFLFCCVSSFPPFPSPPSHSDFKITIISAAKWEKNSSTFRKCRHKDSTQNETPQKPLHTEFLIKITIPKMK